MTASLFVLPQRQTPLPPGDPIGDALHLAAVSIELQLRYEIARLEPRISLQEVDHRLNQNPVLKKVRAALDIWKAVETS